MWMLARECEREREREKGKARALVHTPDVFVIFSKVFMHGFLQHLCVGVRLRVFVCLCVPVSVCQGVLVTSLLSIAVS